MGTLLFIDACISTHASRTKKLCATYIEDFLDKNPGVKLETVLLRKGKVEPLTKEYIKERDDYIREKNFTEPMFDLANQFKAADYIVVGTPYWDLSFASILKVYIENIMVADLTFTANETGFQGLCKGKLLTYITTSGGFIGNKNYGYQYIEGVADMFGIDETQCFTAEGLDIEGMNVEEIMSKATATMLK